MRFTSFSSYVTNAAVWINTTYKHQTMLRLNRLIPAPLRGAAGLLPKTHLAAIAGITLALSASVSILTGDQASPPESASNALDLRIDDIQIATAYRELLLPASFPEGVDERDWQTQTVRNGDNLTRLFQRVNLGSSDVHAVIDSNPEAKSQLARIRPGQEIHFGFDSEGTLQELRYQRSPLEQLTVKREENGFKASLEAREPEVMTVYREGVITSSLFSSGANAEMPHQIILDLAGIFGWDIDFALDIRQGDYFTITYEEKLVDGERVGTGAILAATFSNQNKLYRAVRYVDSEGEARYYTPDGMGMRRAFLRTPVDFTRISSNFNMRRLHPVTKTVRPHRGVDYAAPTGTPVYAAGDGRVIASGYTSTNGNYVVIQHGERFTTKYLHLNQRSIKTGDRVAQGKQIGTVGATGLATGPHLHYEFLVDGVHKDPRTVQLPEAIPIEGQERTRFLRQTQPLIQQLAAFTAQSSQIELASLDSLSNEG